MAISLIMIGAAAPLLFRKKIAKYRANLDWTTQAIGQQHTSPLRTNRKLHSGLDYSGNRTATHQPLTFRNSRWLDFSSVEPTGFSLQSYSTVSCPIPVQRSHSPLAVFMRRAVTLAALAAAVVVADAGARGSQRWPEGTAGRGPDGNATVVAARPRYGPTHRRLLGRRPDAWYAELAAPTAAALLADSGGVAAPPPKAVPGGEPAPAPAPSGSARRYAADAEPVAVCYAGHYRTFFDPAVMAGHLTAFEHLANLSRFAALGIGIGTQHDKVVHPCT